MSRVPGFLTRWRLAQRLDDHRQDAGGGLPAKAPADSAAGRYARALARVDRELAECAPVQSPPAGLRRRTLTRISETPPLPSRLARAPLWPVLTSLTVAAVAMMLFVARPWQPSGRPILSRPQPYSSHVVSASPSLVRSVDDDVMVREAGALVDDTRRFARSLFRDALPFASTPAK